jgi:hypothetical protein
MASASSRVIEKICSSLSSERESVPFFRYGTVAAVLGGDLLPRRVHADHPRQAHQLQGLLERDRFDDIDANSEPVRGLAFFGASSAGSRSTYGP